MKLSTSLLPSKTFTQQPTAVPVAQTPIETHQGSQFQRNMLLLGRCHLHKPGPSRPELLLSLQLQLLLLLLLLLLLFLSLQHQLLLLLLQLLAVVAAPYYTRARARAASPPPSPSPVAADVAEELPSAPGAGGSPVDQHCSQPEPANQKIDPTHRTVQDQGVQVSSLSYGLSGPIYQLPIRTHDSREQEASITVHDLAPPSLRPPFRGIRALMYDMFLNEPLLPAYHPQMIVRFDRLLQVDLLTRKALGRVRTRSNDSPFPYALAPRP